MLVRLPVFLIALLLAGCVQIPKQAFNRDASAHLKTLALSQGPNQDMYNAIIVGHPAAGFGLVGAVIIAAEQQTKSTRLTQAIGVEETRLQAHAATVFAEALTKAGYSVTTFNVEKGTEADAVLGLGRAAVPGADAVLLAAVGGAFVAAGTGGSYVPQMTVKAKLQDVKTGATLFEDTFTYGFASPNMKTVHVAADAKYAWADMDALVKDPEMTRQALRDGAAAIAAQIAADLKRP
jgi:hypothetical protein